MSRSKILNLFTVLLLILNISLLVFIFSGRRGPAHHEGPKQYIIEKLHFDDKQATEYEKLISWHRKEISNREHRLMDLKKTLYSTLAGNPSNISSDSLIQAISVTQVEIEKIHLKHFADIKALCKPEQEKAFEELTTEIAKLFAPKKPGK